MPDAYYYTIGDESGKFIGNTVEALIPYKPIKIKTGGAAAWEIINSNGCRYLFDEGEYSSTTNSSHNYIIGTYTSAWYLTGIISPNNHTIMYQYQSDGQYQKRINTQVVS